MSYFSGIPRRISNLLDLHAPDLAVQKAQVRSSKSQFHGFAVSSSVPEYLAFKLASLHERVDYLNNLQLAIRNLEKSGRISAVECIEISNEIEGSKLSYRREALEIDQFGSRIAEDMSDVLECSPLPDLGEAYAAAMVHIVNSASAKRERINDIRVSHGLKRFNKANFKREILNFYEARKGARGATMTFCHLFGWQLDSLVSAAHLVPESLDKLSCQPLFGKELDPPIDHRNGLSLTRGIEKALDAGKLVFAPIPGETNAWKCVVTIKDDLDLEIVAGKTWKDIDGRQLRFNGTGRPRKRYLFFRYLITYLHQKRMGNLKWAEDIEAEFEEWVSPGAYLHQSPLRTLLQQATGHDLPESMFRMFRSTDDPGLGDLSDKEKRHREENIAHLIDSAVLNTRPAGPDEETESESDEE